MATTLLCYKNEKLLTKAIVILLYCTIVISSIYTMALLRIRHDILNLQNQENLSFEIMLICKGYLVLHLIKLIEWVSSIVIGGLVLTWLYRANRNARALGAEGMQFSPRGSICWYFIPIACLWKPYQALKEIWVVSANLISWKIGKSVAILNGFWFLWIIKLISSLMIPLYPRDTDENIKDLLLHNALLIVSSCINIIIFILVIVIVRRIYFMQNEKVQPTRSQWRIKAWFESFCYEILIACVCMFYFLLPLSFLCYLLLFGCFALLDYLKLI